MGDLTTLQKMFLLLVLLLLVTVLVMASINLGLTAENQAASLEILEALDPGSPAAAVEG